VNDSSSDSYVIKITKLANKYRIMDVENEIRLMKMCDHENIIKMEHCIGYESSVWLSSKQCSYGSLCRMIPIWKKLTEKHIAFIAHQILSGLDYLHNQCHIVHLDIKSDNILVDADYQMKITDFGISYQMDGPDGRLSSMRGTPYWMAPEVILSEKSGCEYDFKADVWSFGVLIWELMHRGKPPLFQFSPVDVLQEIINRPVPKISSDSPWSCDLKDFVSKTLCKDVSDRWAVKQLLSHPFLLNNKHNGDPNELFSF
jgi:serine/threonine protein kinase